MHVFEVYFDFEQCCLQKEEFNEPKTLCHPIHKTYHWLKNALQIECLQVLVSDVRIYFTAAIPHYPCNNLLSTVCNTVHFRNHDKSNAEGTNETFCNQARKIPKQRSRTVLTTVNDTLI